MTVQFPSRTFGPLPEIFQGGLAPSIFEPAQSPGCPFFSSPHFASLIKTSGNTTLDVVITGQQPGFMGGPLYTLYKIATTIALANLRSEQGQPTVPVFWSGDDDDDLVEALAPTAWDPLLGKLFTGHLPPNYSGPRILGELAATTFSKQAQLWFESLSRNRMSNVSASDLAHLYSRALKEKWSWSKLFSAGVELLFPETGLIIVNGNDPRLHEIARPFYNQVLPKLSVLQKLATQDSGQAINKRSIENPLFRIKDGRRLRLRDFPETWDPSLRPGVLLRSLLQDWLLKPRAVVVGPGEKAYLDQLKPLYEEMGVARSPLVPRLFAWLLPANVSIEKFRAFSDISGQQEKHQQWANSIQVLLAEKFDEIFSQESSFTTERAHKQGLKKAMQMTRNLPEYFQTIEQKQQQFSLSEMPPWLMPLGNRQERILPSFNAFALWGSPLIETLLKTARTHLDYGGSGNWQEMLITVPSAKDFNDA